MSELLKKLTGKNKNDYEAAAFDLVNKPNVELFKELVENDSFLFDFVKNNVAQRIENAVNETNFKNLFEFLKYYSPSYEDVIINTFVKYADEDVTDSMLEKFENGTDDEKTYTAKYFKYIHDPLALEFLKKYAYCENEYLSHNCAETLCAYGDREIYNQAIEKLKSNDDFEQLSAVKFLVSYSDKQAVDEILAAMKNSAMAENIAGEIPYLESIFELLDTRYTDGLLVLNNIINGLGEISPLSVVFDYELFDVFERLIHNYNDSKGALVILNAKEKFDILTENDEYLFDEDKETKNEVLDIKKLLKGVNKKELEKYVNDELNENSPFVYTALEFATDVFAVKELLKSNNQTLILKTAEILKSLNAFDETAKTVALLKVTDINIKAIIRSL